MDEPIVDNLLVILCSKVPKRVDHPLRVVGVEGRDDGFGRIPHGLVDRRRAGFDVEMDRPIASDRGKP